MTGSGSSASARIVFVAANPSVDRFIEVDHVVAGAIHRPGSALAVPGGKGLNAARAGALLGGRATVVAILAGRAGDWITERLVELGIDAIVVSDSGSAETRSCLSVLDRSTGRLTEFYEPGSTIQPATWTAFENALRAEVARDEVAAVVCSGSLPPGAPVDGYARIVRIAREVRGSSGRSIAAIVDTHGPALDLAVAERPTIVKVNAAEAAETTGLPVTTASEAAAAARSLIERGVGQVVVTLGADGAVACDGRSAWRLTSPEGAGAYPVGSGDAFVAGLAIGLAEGSSLVDAARRGMAAGIANAMLPGAGNLDPAVAARVAAGVTVTRL